MSRPRVHVLSTGGTIAMTGGKAGATPEKSGSDLVSAVPGLDSYADVSVEEVASSPGFDVSPAVMSAVATRARAVADDVDGVVVTHGTDTLAETAWFLDSTVAGAPAVVTGAQRRPDERSADGPANLVTAVRAAAHPRVEAGGYVAFNDELHAARDAVKAHSQRPDAFRSPNAGPVALCTREGFRFHRDPGRRAPSFPPATPEATVELVTSAAGVGGGQVERALAAGVDGLVVAGTGLGNVTAALGRALVAAADRVPVVLCTRCHAGPTEAVYGTDGGGFTLGEQGLIRAGDLSPPKARVTLLLALAAGDDGDGVAERFAAVCRGDA